MMTSLMRQNGYLNQRVILFRLQYETHSLQMHTKSPCRSVISTKPKLSEGRYALRLVVIPCQYFPSPSPSFQPILPSPSSHIFSVSVLHILRLRINPCCPTSMPPWLPASVFTADLVCHPHYNTSTLCLCCSPTPLLRSSSHYLPSSRVLRRHFLSNLSDQIFSSLYVVLYYTACSNLLRTNFLTLSSDLLTTLFSSILARLFSLSMMFFLCSDLPRFSPLAFTPLCSNLIIPLISV